MKEAMYCRVSSDGQEEDGRSLQSELDACGEYCDGHRSRASGVRVMVYHDASQRCKDDQ